MRLDPKRPLVLYLGLVVLHRRRRDAVRARMASPGARASAPARCGGHPPPASTERRRLAVWLGRGRARQDGRLASRRRGSDERAAEDGLLRHALPLERDGRHQHDRADRGLQSCTVPFSPSSTRRFQTQEGTLLIAYIAAGCNGDGLVTVARSWTTSRPDRRRDRGARGRTKREARISVELRPAARARRPGRACGRRRGRTGRGDRSQAGPYRRARRGGCSSRAPRCSGFGDSRFSTRRRLRARRRRPCGSSSSGYNAGGRSSIGQGRSSSKKAESAEAQTLSKEDRAMEKETESRTLSKRGTGAAEAGQGGREGQAEGREVEDREGRLRRGPGQEGIEGNPRPGPGNALRKQAPEANPAHGARDATEVEAHEAERPDGVQHAQPAHVRADHSQASFTRRTPGAAQRARPGWPRRRDRSQDGEVLEPLARPSGRERS